MAGFDSAQDARARSLARALYRRRACTKWIWVWRKMSEPRYPNGMASQWSERNYPRRRLEHVKRGRKGRWAGRDKLYNMAINMGTW